MILPTASPRRILAAIRPLLTGRIGLLALIALAGLATALAGLVGPWIVGSLVDELRAETSMRPVLSGVAWILGAGVAGGVGTWLGRWWMGALAEPAVASLREDVLDSALAVDSAVVEGGGRGDLVSRVAEDSRVVTEAASVILPMALQSLCVVAVSAAGMTAVDWRLGLVGLIAVPMYYLTLRWYLPRSGPIYAQERIAFGVRSQRVLGGIGGAATLQAFEAEPVELGRIDTASAHARDLSIGVFRFTTRAFSRNNRAEAVVLAALLITGFLLVEAGEMTAGGVATAGLLFHRLFNPIGALVGMFDQIQSAGASLTRMVGVIDLPGQQVAAPPGSVLGAGGIKVAAHADSPGAALDLAGIGHSYEPGRPVLEDVDLRILPGEVVAVVGATGAGKSTLAQIAAGTIPATAGRVHLGDRPLRSLPSVELRRRVSMVSQEVHVFTGTVADNVRVAAPGSGGQDVRSALETVGAARWVRSLPEREHTVVGDGGYRLTPMQEQMLALARIVLADPEFIILDEATAEAGSSGARELESAAAAALAGRGALVVAHRLSQAVAADRVLVMENGRVVESGTHAQLSRGQGLYARLWEAWTAR